MAESQFQLFAGETQLHVLTTRGTQRKPRGKPGAECLKHGQHGEWSRQTSTLRDGRTRVEFRCLRCTREQYHAAKVREWHKKARVKGRKAANEKARKARSYYLSRRMSVIVDQYGDEVARLAEKWVASGRGSISVAALFVELLMERNPSKTIRYVRRMVELSIAAKQPLDSVAWRCNACGLGGDDPSFFDFDHVIPRRRLKADGRRSPRQSHLFHGNGNLQVLCPNCHRRKSLSEERGGRL